VQTAPVTSVSATAENNARWCDLITTTHGGHGQWSADAWTCPTRTPPLYPDAVTLRPDVDARALLRRLDRSTGCSVKDSFGSLDLHAHGFHVLFDAQWIARRRSAADGGTPAGWERIDDQGAFDRWVEAWAGVDGTDASPWHPGLLQQPEVALFGRVGERDGPIRAGLVLNRDANVVGVTNVFTLTGALDATWAAIPRLAAVAFPDVRAVCGYEAGPDLALAAGAGFGPIGALRVWIKG
jgi:hypothetical protein